MAPGPHSCAPAPCARCRCGAMHHTASPPLPALHSGPHPGGPPAPPGCRDHAPPERGGGYVAGQGGNRLRPSHTSGRSAATCTPPLAPPAPCTPDPPSHTCDSRSAATWTTLAAASAMTSTCRGTRGRQHEGGAGARGGDIPPGCASHAHGREQGVSIISSSHPQGRPSAARVQQVLVQNHPPPRWDLPACRWRPSPRCSATGEGKTGGSEVRGRKR